MPGDSPGGPVPGQCRGPGFSPWLGNWMPQLVVHTLQLKIPHPAAKGSQVPQRGPRILKVTAAAQ